MIVDASAIIAILRNEPEAQLLAAKIADARQTYRDFGKGSGHPAKLNFGDYFAYALAKTVDEPLLFKGTDFGQTDVLVA
jgi:ribonuclease VapC